VKISSALARKDNNFNALRMLGAIAIVIAHGYNVTSGRVESDDPVEALIYASGFRALDLFFIFSGFLVTASLLQRRDGIRFWVSRVLRLFPALLVVSVAVVFTIGPLNTDLPLADYVLSGETWLYPLVTGLTTHPDMPLPGVFETLPVAGAVNVPVWTLRYELILYAGVFLAFCCGLLTHERAFAAAFAVLLLAYGALTALTELRDQIAFVDHAAHFSVSFAFGAVFWVFRRVLPLSVGPMLALWASAWLLAGTPLSELAGIVAAGYSFFWLAFVPTGWLRQYNRLGDYSYGLYLVHWPIAQTLHANVPDLPPLLIGACSLALSLPLAVASWHVIEKPCLARVDDTTRLVKRAVADRRGASA